MHVVVANMQLQGEILWNRSERGILYETYTTFFKLEFYEARLSGELRINFCTTCPVRIVLRGTNLQPFCNTRAEHVLPRSSSSCDLLLRLLKATRAGKASREKKPNPDISNTKEI